MFRQENLSLLNLCDVNDDVIGDVICSLKSYIRGSAEFFGTQHSLISMRIYPFVSGLCTDPQVKCSLLLLVIEFI